MKRSKIVVLALVVAAAAGFLACKQGIGDRCQIDDDCSDGLICNTGTGRCAASNSSGIDAGVPDAMIDAPLDAKVFMDAKIFLDAP